ncbi:HEAT repeat domain-containing protein [Paenibacillus sp. 19GGS1-52]|uniref:HEAT repeat domain-containing protein n=1 Tax=Paenibacillus monticola TaxID=2666075 RepID=A0A7X2HA01_9BACL|nr:MULTISPECIES: HEAT repeat domain-containing protein [Paenibacillus]MRN56279.1 HEAT repeat domain-containing protein [Paenibacillus monticola]ULO06829.1 HEAT repeat domain-containing protein [Paenibacillus sp. 19GGS1-52]
MSNEEIVNELPENYEELKREANRSGDWRARLAAVEELGQTKHSKIIDILTRLMTSDPVYTVQEAAYLKLKAFGEDVKAPSKNKPELVKGVSKILIRIKKSLPQDHSFEEFKEKLKKMRVDIYDAYEGEKGPEFDSWLSKMWTAEKK